MDLSHIDNLAPGKSTPTLIEEVLVTTLNALNAPPPLPKVDCPAAEHPALGRCIRAYNQAYKAAKARGTNRFDSEKEAKLAYCQAMPPLVGQQNIRDFIACLAHAMLTEIISHFESSKLLYAAQVAFAAREARPHHKPQPAAKSSPKAPLNPTVPPLESNTKQTE